MQSLQLPKRWHIQQTIKNNAFFFLIIIFISFLKHHKFKISLVYNK